MAANGVATAGRQVSEKEADIQMMLSADVHLGTKNCNYQMERYVFKRRDDGKLSHLHPNFIVHVILYRSNVSTFIYT
jgi:hypothetical protein